MNKHLSLLCALLCAQLLHCACASSAADTTAPETTVPATDEITTEAVTVPDTTEGERVAGKKYFTLSFDDGVTQDEKFIELLKSFGLYSCTFNVNTGLMGQTENINIYDCLVTHNRIAVNTVRKGVYSGFEVAVHGYSHPYLDKCTDEKVIEEITKDADNIARYTKITPVGMAYPGGNFYTEHTIDVILQNTGIRYARTVTSTYSFELPARFMEWNPTIQASDERLMELAQAFIDAEPAEGEVLLFYVWGHTFEFDIDHYTTWRELGEFLTLMSGRDDIEYVTNGEFYGLYKDRIPS